VAVSVAVGVGVGVEVGVAVRVGVAVGVGVTVTAAFWMKRPKATGPLPTEIVSLTVFVAVLITDTLLAPLFVM
jgi:hypothetical protein